MFLSHIKESQHFVNVGTRLNNGTVKNPCIFIAIFAMTLIFQMCCIVYADNIESDSASITIIRNDSYVTEPDAGQTAPIGNLHYRPYEWYKVFHASYGDDHEARIIADTYDSETGVLSELQSSAEDLPTGVTYYLDTTDDAEIIAKYTPDNEYFSLKPSANGSQVYVTWKNDKVDSETIQAAARWIIINKAYIDSGSLYRDAKDGSSWTRDNLEKGYYLIKGLEGKNLIAVTTDVTIHEKNSYPTIDKKEKDEDIYEYTDGQRGDGPGDPVKVAVGDIIDYKIIVHVPHSANQPMGISDSMSTGLTLVKDTLEVTADSNPVPWTRMTRDDDNEYLGVVNGWEIKINSENIITIQGKDIVITFKAVINSDALVSDALQRNKVFLNYNNSMYKMTDEVHYDTYATGILKYDGTTANVTDDGTLVASDPDKTIKYLQGVTFQLQEKSHENDSEWIDVPVTKGDGNYYRPIDTTKKTPEKSETITTDDNGQILIRGLDGDKNYQLLEINPAPGYNSMDEPAQLTLSLEDYSSTSVSIDQGNETSITYLSLKSIAKISNKPGTVLPSTGGIGTTILYATGAILVLGAGILLVTRRRMSVN